MIGTMRRTGQATLAALALIAGATAAPAMAQVLLYPTTYPTGPMDPGDPMVGVPLPGATPAEARARLIWNLRSGLNVAALQCQFSPYLRTVDNYNAILAHHSRELAAAYTALEGYFRRIHGPRNGPRRFDDYSTQTYNNFSTLQAQLGFCQTASRIGKDTLARPKGQFLAVAQARMRELRASLTAVADNYYFTRMPVPLAPLALTQDCSALRGRERRECEGN
ncbi:hypothetical protein [Sphingosinicella sp.]|uniref:hypothetical protein n=1 Tax=Sphingosinicella sp. TaxID=1917971 RepID=UPI0040377CE0